MAKNKTASKKSALKKQAKAAPAARSVEKARAAPIITSMTPNHLGLKIGVCYAGKSDMAGFLPIIGWASVGNYLEAGKAAFSPIIKGPGNHPMLASPATVKGYVGLFPIEATVGDILAGPSKERPA
jgi:hypothetical protein